MRLRQRLVRAPMTPIRYWARGCRASSSSTGRDEEKCSPSMSRKTTAPKRRWASSTCRTSISRTEDRSVVVALSSPIDGGTLRCVPAQSGRVLSSGNGNRTSPSTRPQLRAMAADVSSGQTRTSLLPRARHQTNAPRVSRRRGSPHATGSRRPGDGRSVGWGHAGTLLQLADDRQ